MKIYVVTLITAVGLLVGCNQSIEQASQKYNELPPAVQKTVRAQAPNGEIDKVSHKTENGIELDVIEFREPGTNPKIIVASAGKPISIAIHPGWRFLFVGKATNDQRMTNVECRIGVLRASSDCVIRHSSFVIRHSRVVIRHSFFLRLKPSLIISNCRPCRPDFPPAPV